MSTEFKINAGNKRRSRLRRAAHLAVALALGLSFPACSKKADPAAIQARADAYFKAGKYDEAKIEYMNLLRAGARDSTGFRQIGIICVEEGAPMLGIPYLLKALEMAPTNTEARMKLAYALLSVGEVASARKEARRILDEDPGNDEALLLMAETAFSLSDMAETRGEIEKLADPNRARVHLALATLAARVRDLATAEAEVDKALALDPKLIPAHLAKANLYLAKKETAKAGESLKIAANLSPPRGQAKLRLVEFKLNSSEIEEAKAMLKEMTEQTRDFIPAWRMRAQLEFAAKHNDEALTLLENIFARDPNNIEARLLQAQVLTAKGETKKVVEAIERLNNAFPKVPAIRLRLAQAYLQDGNLRQAETILSELVVSNPDYFDAVLALGELRLRSSEFQTTVEMMTDLLKKRPGFLQAQLLLADGYRGLGRFDDAAQVFRQQIKDASAREDPSKPAPRFMAGAVRDRNSSPAARAVATPYFMLGVVLRQKGDLQEARIAFEKTLEYAPDNFQATTQLVELDLLAKDFDSALQRAQKELDLNAESPVGHFLFGKIYAAQHDWVKAEASLLKAIELDPNAAAAYELLVSTYVQTDRISEAIQKLEARLAEKPNLQSALLASAMLYDRTKNYAKARDAYEKLLALNPEALVALNNLAMLHTDHFNQLDKAYELARKARALRADDPAVADTLGWVMYKRGDYNQALALFSESAAKLSDNAEILYHLGMANYMMGRTEQARVALQSAVASSTAFAGKDEARKRLAVISEGGGKTAELSAAELEAIVKQQPNDVVTKVRLGEAYEAQGAFAKAATAYEEALRLNPKLVSAMVKLAQLYLGPQPNPTKAMDLAKKARVIAPNDPKITELFGRATFQGGNYSLAYSLLQESARQASVEPGTVYDFAMAAYFVGRGAQARETMERVLKQSPEFAKAEDARTFLALTALADSGKDLASAEQRVQKILSEKPSDVPALMIRAALAAERGDSKSAEGTYAGIVGKFPDFAPAQKRLAVLYAANPANRDKAYALAMKARRTMAEDGDLTRLLAELSYHRKDYTSAVRQFKESARSQPLDAAGLYYLGLSQAQMKENKDAAESLRGALDAGLKDPMAEDAKRVLGELGS